jgi:hypothetical protein
LHSVVAEDVEVEDVEVADEQVATEIVVEADALPAAPTAAIVRAVSAPAVAIATCAQRPVRADRLIRAEWDIGASFGPAAPRVRRRLMLTHRDCLAAFSKASSCVDGPGPARRTTRTAQPAHRSGAASTRSA